VQSLPPPAIRPAGQKLLNFTQLCSFLTSSFFIQYLGYRKRLVTVNIEQHQAGKDKCSLLCPFEKIVSGDRTLSPEKIAQILKEF